MAALCRYSAEWEKTVHRLGRWIDFKNDYKTLDPEFMESVWWVQLPPARACRRGRCRCFFVWGV